MIEFMLFFMIMLGLCVLTAGVVFTFVKNDSAEPYLSLLVVGLWALILVGSMYVFSNNIYICTSAYHLHLSNGSIIDSDYYNQIGNYTPIDGTIRGYERFDSCKTLSGTEVNP